MFLKGQPQICAHMSCVVTAGGDGKNKGKGPFNPNMPFGGMMGMPMQGVMPGYPPHGMQMAPGYAPYTQAAYPGYPQQQYGYNPYYPQMQQPMAQPQMQPGSAMGYPTADQTMMYAQGGVQPQYQAGTDMSQFQQQQPQGQPLAYQQQPTMAYQQQPVAFAGAPGTMMPQSMQMAGASAMQAPGQMTPQGMVLQPMQPGPYAYQQQSQQQAMYGGYPMQPQGMMMPTQQGQMAQQYAQQPYAQQMPMQFSGDATGAQQQQNSALLRGQTAPQQQGGAPQQPIPQQAISAPVAQQQANNIQCNTNPNNGGAIAGQGQAMAQSPSHQPLPPKTNTADGMDADAIPPGATPDTVMLPPGAESGSIATTLGNVAMGSNGGQPVQHVQETPVSV
jgi:hypothetical protein